MNKPASYPKTAAAEKQAVLIFESLVDCMRVHTEIQTLDRVPNIDGFVEILDEEGYPIGKFDVQVKKMKADATKFPCPIKLVEYSKVSGSPVVLVCVDVKNKKAYWRHIFPSMPGVLDQTETFTVNFDPTHDAINQDKTYLRRWINLTEQHLEKIQKYPQLIRQFKQKVTVETIPSHDIYIYQLYLDQINSLLDRDFLTVKKMLLPDTWKIGLGIVESNKRQIIYQVYKLNYGQAGPLICSIEPDNSDGLDLKNIDRLSQVWTVRENFEDPAKKGNAFVSSLVKEIFESSSFYIRGDKLALDIVFNFIDHHGHCLGLKPYQETYDIESVRRGIYDYLPSVYALIDDVFQEQCNWDSESRNFECFSLLVQEHNLLPVISSKGKYDISEPFSFPQVDLLSDSIEHLQSKNISLLKRLYKLPGELDSLNSSDQSLDSLFQYQSYKLQKILKSALEDYSAFVRGNLLDFPESPYLNQDISIVCCVEKTLSAKQKWYVALHEYFVKNDGSLKKILFLKRDVKLARSKKGAFLKIRGKQFQCTSKITVPACEYLGRFPILDRIYAMLREDLELHYGSEFSYSYTFNRF